MSIVDKCVITFLTTWIFMAILLSHYSLTEQIEKIDPIIDQQICEEVLPYRYRGRQHLVCYNGDGVEYTQPEVIVINQWKNNL